MSHYLVVKYGKRDVNTKYHRVNAWYMKILDYQLIPP